MQEGLSCKTDEEICELLDELLCVARQRPALGSEVKDRCGEFLRRLRNEEIGDARFSAMLESAMMRVKAGGSAFLQ